MSDSQEVDTIEFELPPAGAPLEPPPFSSSSVHVEVGARSHAGLVRPNNEDSFFVARLGRWLETLQTNLPGTALPPRFEEVGYLLLVADGIGGAAAGEVASRMAIAASVNHILRKTRWLQRVEPAEVRPILDRMLDDIRRVDSTLKEQAQADAALAGMGSTLTIAYSVGAHLFLAHVGDSRAYLFRGGTLLQLTRDHTLARSMAEAGLIPPDEVATHRLRHVLTHALGGAESQVEADVQHVPLADGDCLLLCSDGLTDMVGDARIAAALGGAASPAEACDALVGLALAAGGRDNVTAVVARYIIPEGVAAP